MNIILLIEAINISFWLGIKPEELEAKIIEVEGVSYIELLTQVEEATSYKEVKMLRVILAELKRRLDDRIRELKAPLKEVQKVARNYQVVLTAISDKFREESDQLSPSSVSGNMSFNVSSLVESLTGKKPAKKK
jgi:hypothetical protein